MQRQLKRALAGPQARQILGALLARRLPGPLRVLVQGLADPDQRGFLFWWLVLTLAVTLVMAVLLSIALVPIAGILALAGVSVWMLIRQVVRPPRSEGEQAIPKLPSESARLQGDPATQ